MVSRPQCPASPIHPQPLRFCQVPAQSSILGVPPNHKRACRLSSFPTPYPWHLGGGQGLNVEEEEKDTAALGIPTRSHSAFTLQPQAEGKHQLSQRSQCKLPQKPPEWSGRSEQKPKSPLIKDQWSQNRISETRWLKTHPYSPGTPPSLSPPTPRCTNTQNTPLSSKVVALQQPCACM